MKYKILILDIYPKAKYRISKDLNGGYGTGNDYGDSWFSKLLKLSITMISKIFLNLEFL